MASKEATQQTSVVFSFFAGAVAAVGAVRNALCRPKRFALGVPVRILLPVVHLLQKLPRLLLVCKGQASQAVLELKGVEEGPVLVVGKSVVYFLVPYYPSASGLSPISSQDWARSQGTDGRTDISTSFIQKVLPTRSLASTAAPCKPV